MAITGSPTGGAAQGMWNDPNSLKQSHAVGSAPQTIGEKLTDTLVRLHKIEAALTSVNDRIYGPVPRGVAQAVKDHSANHLAVLSEMSETVARCEEEVQRLDRGV